VGEFWGHRRPHLRLYVINSERFLELGKRNVWVIFTNLNYVALFGPEPAGRCHGSIASRSWQDLFDEPGVSEAIMVLLDLSSRL